MMRFGTPKNLLITVLGAAVVGLGSWVAVDHLSRPATVQSAALTASSVTAPTSRPGAHTYPFPRSHGWAGFRGGASFGGFGTMGLLKQIQTDIGLPATTIFADVQKGETLAQIAGSKAAKVESDIDSAVQQQLGRMESSGAISSAQEAQLSSDAQNAVSVLMNAKLGSLFHFHTS